MPGAFIVGRNNKALVVVLTITARVGYGGVGRDYPGSPREEPSPVHATRHVRASAYTSSASVVVVYARTRGLQTSKHFVSKIFWA